MATKKQLADAKKLLEQTKARQKDLNAQLAKVNQTIIDTGGTLKPQPFTQPMSVASAGIKAATTTDTTDDSTVTNWRGTITAEKDSKLGALIEQQNAARAARDAAFAAKPTTDPGVGYVWRWQERNQQWAKIFVGTPGGSSGGVGGASGGNGSNGGGTDTKTLDLIESLQQQIAALTNQQAKADAEAKAAAAKAAESQRQSIISVLTSRFNQYGLGSLVNKIKELAVDGATEATITLALQETEEYKQRFAANQDRIKKGLAVLSPAEYLASEDAYRQTLRAYGLTQFDNDQYVRQFISNDVSPQELSSRVSIAVQRVQNADPAVTKTLRDYYGIGVGDMVGYILDPNQALPKIQQQVAAAEIGTAARRQGLEAGVTVAEQLARQGITEAEAQKGYATIADILPSAEKLSQIYGTSLEEYGQTEAEQEVFNSLASAQRKRRALTAREVATFSGSSGTGRGSLGTSTAGQI